MKKSSLPFFLLSLFLCYYNADLIAMEEKHEESPLVLISNKFIYHLSELQKLHESLLSTEDLDDETYIFLKTDRTKSIIEQTKNDPYNFFIYWCFNCMRRSTHCLISFLEKKSQETTVIQNYLEKYHNVFDELTLSYKESKIVSKTNPATKNLKPWKHPIKASFHDAAQLKFYKDYDLSMPTNFSLHNTLKDDLAESKIKASKKQRPSSVNRPKHRKSASNNL